MSPKKRTEEEILTQTGGIKVLLGGKAYTLPPPVIRKAKLFRQHLQELSIESNSLGQKVSDNPEEAEKEVMGFLMSMPERILDLFFEYAGDNLNREEIESTATEFEIAKAFVEVLKTASPLAAGLLRELGAMPT